MKYYGGWDALSPFEIETRCWLDLLKISNTMPNARNKLQALKQSVVKAHLDTGRQHRRNANAQNNTGTWHRRVAKTVIDIDTCPLAK